MGVAARENFPLFIELNFKIPIEFCCKHKNKKEAERVQEL